MLKGLELDAGRLADYHHSIKRSDERFTLEAGFAVRRRRSGHCTIFTIFSAIEPNAIGCHPVMPCVEITTKSIFSLSMTSTMSSATSFPSSMEEFTLIPLASRSALHAAKRSSAVLWYQEGQQEILSVWLAWTQRTTW